MFGAAIIGAVVSFTVTVNVFVDVLPAASFAVTVTVVVPITNVAPEPFEYVIVGDAGPHRSPSPAANVDDRAGGAGRLDRLSSRAPSAITGAVVSRTVTVKVFVVVLPAAVGRRHGDRRRPDREERPGRLRVGDRQRRRPRPSPSRPRTSQSRPSGRRLDRDVGGCTVSAGAVVSRTVTLKVFVATLRCPSVAVTVTVVVPSANVEFEAIDVVIVTGPTASVAVGAKVAFAPAGSSPRPSRPAP